MPLLTRLFSPEFFGLAALYTALIQITGSFCTWRFDWSVPNANSDRGAAHRIICGLLVLAVVVVSLFPLITILTKSVLGYEYLNKLGNSLFLLPLAVAGIGFHQLLQSWFIRQGNLTPVSRTKIAQTLSYVVIAIMAYFANFKAMSLILAVTFSGWFGVTILLRHALPIFTHIRDIKCRRILGVFIQNIRITSISTLVAFFNNISSTFALFALSIVFSSIEIGLYSLVLRIVATPLTMVSTAITQSFWSRASELAREKHYGVLWSTYLKMTKYLLLAGLIVAVGCLSLSFILVPILGSSWSGSDSVLRAMIPMFIGIVAFTPTNHLVVLDHQSYQLIADFLRLTLIAFAVCVSYIANVSFVHAVFFVACSSLLGHMAIFLIHLRYYKQGPLASIDR